MMPNIQLRIPSGMQFHRLSMRTFLTGTVLSCTLLASSATVLAQVDVPRQTVILQEDVLTTLKGRLQGPDKATRDFVIHVKPGASLSVSLRASQPTSTHFNILPPGSTEALFVGEMQDQEEWQQQVQVGGDYTVRIYLNRAVARRGSTSDYTLNLRSF